MSNSKYAWEYERCLLQFNKLFIYAMNVAFNSKCRYFRLIKDATGMNIRTKVLMTCTAEAFWDRAERVHPLAEYGKKLPSRYLATIVNDCAARRHWRHPRGFTIYVSTHRRTMVQRLTSRVPKELLQSHPALTWPLCPPQEEAHRPQQWHGDNSGAVDARSNAHHNTLNQFLWTVGNL